MGMFDYGFYNPGNNYGYKSMPGPWAKAKSYMDTYPGGLDTELNPEAYFTHLLAQQGYGGLTNKSSNARNLYGRIYDAYGAARLKNNQLKWKDFVDPIDFGQALAGMSAQDKGINQSNSAPMDVRWLPR